jgi:hypothetical protein
MAVKITWYVIDDENKSLWQVNRGLYAYLSLENEILYIGKVNGTTVRRRFQPSAKPVLWDFIVNDLGHTHVKVIVGLIDLPQGSRHSKQLLSDIESLLIYEIKPPGNVACRDTRISRPGLSIICYRDLHYFRKKFRDKLIARIY